MPSDWTPACAGVTPAAVYPYSRLRRDKLRQAGDAHIKLTSPTPPPRTGR
ncbi:MAG: hypothetical protein AAF633_19090 [Chloroflexota bacterium]